MKCPCCESNTAIMKKIPELHLFCKQCLHCYKRYTLHKNHYKQLSGRSRNLEKSLEKKNIERIKFIGKYLQNGIQILELGCAEGFLGEAVKRNFDINYCGIEPSRDAEIAKTKLDNVWESLKKIPPDTQFNIILAFHVLEHIRNIRVVLSKLFTLLNDDGILIMEVPNYFGNKRLPWDFNKEHIHLFSPSSISCALEKRGFKIIELKTGFYESAIYNDSIRVIAYKENSSKELKYKLIDHFQQYLGDQYIIYGIGGDFEALVLPYIKASNVIAIIDSSKNKIGRCIIGKNVQGPEAISNYQNKKILISTYKYQNEILMFLDRKGIDITNIVTLEDIYAT